VEVWQTSNLRQLGLGEEIKEHRKKIEETTGQNIMSASATQGGHKKETTEQKYNGLPYYIGRP